MSGSVTPARRPREDDEREIEEFDVSVDGEGTPRSSASKRPRLDEDAGVDSVSEPEESDLLPDSFRRSPKGKQRAVDGLSNGHAPNQHQPGSIVRVKLTNFVTYTNAEFHPGPNLNMIIGPNGTGKSTLVCAICLGLGWATSHLGRAKDLGEFVKHGAKRAIIEIELAGDPRRNMENQIIQTTIIREGNKSEYTVNGGKKNKKAVQLLARSFSIQVDNLCQFLPQDRVVEFAALSPVDLLTHTQRAAAPQEMSDWHDELKKLRQDQKRQEAEQQRSMETLKADQKRQQSQEADVVRLRERADLLQRSKALEKLRPFPEYQAARSTFAAAKAREKEAAKELRHLQRRVDPNLEGMKAKETYMMTIAKKKDSRKRVLERYQATVVENSEKIKSVHTKIETCTKQIEAEKKTTAGAKQNKMKYQQELARIKRALDSPPEQPDFAEMNARLRDMQRRIRSLGDDRAEIDDTVESLKAQARQRADIIRGLVKEMEGLQSKAGQQVNKLKTSAPGAATAWEWIQANPTAFRSPVFGPPIISCKVKDPSYADVVETMIPDSEKLAFTVTSHEDFKMLQNQLYTNMKLSGINIRNSTQPLSTFQPPVSNEQLQQYGLQGWVLDLLEGPDEVRAMLCDNRFIHQTAYTTREISSDEYRALERSQVNSWVTPTQSYKITRRREYGDHATSTQVQAVRKARYFTDAPVDQQATDEIDERISGLKVEIQGYQKQIEDQRPEARRLATEIEQAEQAEKDLKDEKDLKQRKVAEYNGLSVKEQGAQRKLDEAQQQIDGFRDRVKARNDEIDNLAVAKGQHTLDYTNSVEFLRSLYFQLHEDEIIYIEAKSDFEQLKAQHAEEAKLLEERQNELEQLTIQKNQARDAGNALGEICAELGRNINPYEAEVQNEIINWQPDQLETELQSVNARLEMAGANGNGNLIREFELRAERIKTTQKALEETEAKLANLETQIADIRDRWEPRLDALVAEISEAFGENFARIQCAGEVMVHKDDDFEQWSIEIKVKFRENEQLSVLDSHRQSGGERAVSTIFYLMALQSLARAPFRVVDEINQGMDPRNERLVHSRMVDIACAEHTSQYFLITPKLLDGLKYHPNMKVHCIASGEYMPQDHRELDFGMQAKRALALKAGSGGSVSVAG